MFVLRRASVRRRVCALVLAVTAAAVLVPGADSAIAKPTPKPSSTATTPATSDAAAAAAAAAQAAAEAAAQAAADEAAAAQSVALLQAQYKTAAAELRKVQAQVSAAAAAYAEGTAELERLTTAATEAQVAADRARVDAEAADRLVRSDAAQAYMQSGGSMNAWGIYLHANGIRDLMDLRAGIDAVGTVRQRHLEDAARAATKATDEEWLAETAQSLQERATGALKDQLAAAQAKVAQAAELASQIFAQQQEMLVELASLHRTTVAAEQARQDGTGAKQHGGPGTPMLAPFISGGSADLTAAQLDARSVARRLMPLYGFADSQFSCLDQLWNGESGWNWSATNPSSGAYGIPQSLPATKMASAGSDWLINPQTQIAWGLGYLKAAYGSPCAAWSKWLSRSPHWY